MRWARQVACTDTMRNTYKNLVRKPEGKRSLKRFRCRWENNINIIRKKIRWEGVDRIHLAQNRARGGFLQT